MPIEGPSTTVLFDAASLGHFLGKPGQVAEERAEVVERVVWGWLAPVLGLTERPSTGTSAHVQVFSWAIELGAIAHENPAGRSAKELGTSRSAFSEERRRDILTQAAGFGSTVAPGSPQGDFPPAPVYPDPALPSRRW